MREKRFFIFCVALSLLAINSLMAQSQIVSEMGEAVTNITGSFLDNPYHHSNTKKIFDIAGKFDKALDEMYDATPARNKEDLYIILNMKNIVKWLDFITANIVGYSRGGFDASEWETKFNPILTGFGWTWKVLHSTEDIIFYEYSKDNLCILHLRCTDYMNSPELFLEKRYWIKGMKYMKSIRPDMEFLIVTNDVREANKFLPGVPAVSNDLAKDYSIIKNAHYLLLSNSSFTYFPALCSETVKFILAPKYWARHNVSNGYWASEQNIYSIFNYMDRKGRVYSAEECRQELEEYKKRSAAYKRINKKPGKIVSAFYFIESEFLYKRYRIKRLASGLIRRIKRLAVSN